MSPVVEYSDLDSALKRSGTSWNAAQSHGLLCSRLSVRGAEAGPEWMAELTESAGHDATLTGDSKGLLDTLYKDTWRQLAERQSAFTPLLPDDRWPASRRAGALANWCEGYLHGLVSGRHPERVKARLASEPLSEIIKDFLQITRAVADDEAREESNEKAYTELVEYVRVAAQLAYEELAGVRTRNGSSTE
jgi:uncharacterized protein